MLVAFLLISRVKFNSPINQLDLVEIFVDNTEAMNHGKRSDGSQFYANG